MARALASVGRVVAELCAVGLLLLVVGLGSAMWGDEPEDRDA